MMTMIRPKAVAGRRHSSAGEADSHSIIRRNWLPRPPLFCREIADFRRLY
jgi:hypothetical protein